MYGDNSFTSSKSYGSTSHIEWSVDYDRHLDVWELLVWNRGSLSVDSRETLNAHDERSAISESVNILTKKYPQSYFSKIFDK